MNPPLRLALVALLAVNLALSAFAVLVSLLMIGEDLRDTSQELHGMFVVLGVAGLIVAGPALVAYVVSARRLWTGDTYRGSKAALVGALYAGGWLTLAAIVSLGQTVAVLLLPVVVALAVVAMWARQRAGSRPDAASAEVRP